MANIDSKMLAINWMSASAFVPVNKLIARKFGIDFAVLLAETINQYKRWFEQNKLQDDMFYWTEEDCEMETTLKKGKQAKIFKEMEDHSLLKRHTKRLVTGKTTRYIHIFWDAVAELMINDDEQMKQKIKNRIEERKQKQKIHKMNFVLKSEKTSIKTESSSEVSNTNFPEVPESNFGKFQNGTQVISNINKNINNNNNINNLNHNHSVVDKYNILWNSKIPQDLKNKIKVMMVDNIINLSAVQIQLIEDAYFYQVNKGYIEPKCSNDDTSAINDYEFSLAISKMLKTVKNIDNMNGLIQKWVSNAFDYKIRTLDKPEEGNVFDQFRMMFS